MEQNEADKTPRDRSPSYPFISLKSAVSRLEEFDVKFGRQEPTADRVYLAWGMKGDTSQSQQTLAALKSFGLIDYKGSGPKRPVAISDQGRKYIRAQQDSIKRDVLKALALKPKWIAHFWAKWGTDKVPDEIRLDALVLEHKFNENAAPKFLKVYDETIAFSGLTSSDKVDPVDLGDDEEEDEGVGVDTQVEPVTPPSVRRAPPSVGMKEDTFNLNEGAVVLQWPERLSKASYEDLESWLQLELRKIKRGIADDGAAN